MLVSSIAATLNDKASDMVLDAQHPFDLMSFESLPFCAEGMALAQNFLLKCAKADESSNSHDPMERHKVSDSHGSWRSYFAVCPICSS